MVPLGEPRFDGLNRRIGPIGLIRHISPFRIEGRHTRHNGPMEIGRVQTLRMLRRTSNGIYLTDGEKEVLLPFKETSERERPGEEIEVYVHLDSEDRIIATRRRPFAQVGEFAPMRVISVGPSGAFLDQGLDKDLLLPHGEMLKQVREDSTVVVRLEIDKVSGRLMGTTKLRKYMEKAAYMPLNEEVEVMVTGSLETGWRLIVNERYEGALFETDRHRIGDRFQAYVRDVQDGRVIVSSRPQGKKAAVDFADTLRQRLKAQGGFLPFHDGSPSD
ncbi:hypothetical protein EON81_01010, partial [bacterium]